MCMELSVKKSDFRASVVRRESLRNRLVIRHPSRAAEEPPDHPSSVDSLRELSRNRLIIRRPSRAPRSRLIIRRPSRVVVLGIS